MTGGTPAGTERRGARTARWHLVLVLVAVLAVVGGLLAWSVARTGDRDRLVGGPAAAGDAAPTTGVVPPGAVASSTRPTTTAAPATTTTAPPGPAAITLAFAGDLLPHQPLNDQAAAYGRAVGKPYDFAPMLAPMAPILGAADAAICHMEVPLAPPGEAISSYPSFGAPAELVDGIAAAGYDGCSTASNHSLDRGRAGIATLLDRFDERHLRHAGTARVPEEGGGVATTYDIQGVQVAHLSYAYDFNGYRIPADAPWAVNQIDPARIRSDAATARAAGADLVVVSLHWGTEYESAPSAYQRDVAQQVLPSPDIDLVIGHHAHVVQPIELVEGTYVVWGLGNQLSNQTQDVRRDGLTVVVRAVPGEGRWTVTGVEAVPTWVDLPSFRVLPVVPTLNDPATPPGLRDQLAASYDRTAAVVAGPATPGVALAPRP